MNNDIQLTSTLVLYIDQQFGPPTAPYFASRATVVVSIEIPASRPTCWHTASPFSSHNTNKTSQSFILKADAYPRSVLVTRCRPPGETLTFEIMPAGAVGAVFQVDQTVRGYSLEPHMFPTPPAGGTRHPRSCELSHEVHHPVFMAPETGLHPSGRTPAGNLVLLTRSRRARKLNHCKNG